MNQLQIFKNETFGEVRTIEEQGKIVFCGSDIAKALGYTNPQKAVKDHCREDGVTFCSVTDNIGRTQQAKFISEGNVYRLITHSKLEKAQEFESWVFDEILPTIRKTGGYVSNDEMFINTYLPFADEQTKLLFKTTLNTVKQLNSKIEQDKPKVLFADAVEKAHTSILIGDLAKLIRQNGVEMGQNRLFSYLRNQGFLIKSGESRNMPTQKAMELGLFEVKERTISNPDGTVRITKTTKVTGKGQTYFINRLIGQRFGPCSTIG
ncbi:phage antirepressor [Congzhengia minquanensis]|uniref:Phage antirepressor KilAC domain-containing protein n=1 Tax=Congzhengia minquanensis TaxID=2763657 RepID=A0A926DMY5_9FIRM|nr:phage antirepressor KilAC domain-containing protein [Congzhengia minquanensis]MBC8540657.1 phage antirepressor KilAC domain-containing protein [Congzhengia minquanensis]